MPIHQTKLIMAKPHATGCVRPRCRCLSGTARSRRPSAWSPRAGHAEDGKPAQRRARREHDTRDLLSDRPEGLALPYDSEFSVDGSIPGSPVFTSLVAILASSLLTLRRQMFHRRILKFGVWIQHRGHILSSATSIQIGEHLVTALIGLEFRHLLCLSLMLPKVIAEAGQACWQAVTTSPSRMDRFSLSPLSWPPRCAARSNCTSPSRRASAP